MSAYYEEYLPKPLIQIIDEVECYGPLEDNSNFEVICQNEEDDFMWLTRDPKQLKGWEEIVSHLKGKGIEVVEISAV